MVYVTLTIVMGVMGQSPCLFSTLIYARYLIEFVFIKLFCLKNKSKNIILLLIFWDLSQFGSYIFITVNLIPVIFNLELIWFLQLTY